MTTYKPTKKELYLNLKIQKLEIERLNNIIKNYEINSIPTLEHNIDVLVDSEDRLNSIINEYEEKIQMLDSVCRSLEFSAPENDYIFKERLREIIDKLKELKGSDKE